MTAGVAGGLRIVPLTEDLRGQAEDVARAAYAAECAHVAALPADAKVPSLSHFAGNGMGVAALRADTLVGYLSAYPAFDDAFGVPGLRGTFSPVEAMGVHLEVVGPVARARVVTAMYASAADLWAGARAASHSVAIYAHDSAAEGALFRLGFGLRCSDAIAPVGALKGAGTAVTGMGVREFLRDEVPRLIALANGLIGHLNGGPSFLAHRQQTEAELVAQARKGARFFVAERAGEPVAYLRVSATGESFVASHPSMRSITGAYCVPELRGAGIAAALVSHVAATLEAERVERVGVDFDTLNPAANAFWLKHLTAYTHSMVRRLDAVPSAS